MRRGGFPGLPSAAYPGGLLGVDHDHQLDRQHAEKRGQRHSAQPPHRRGAKQLSGVTGGQASELVDQHIGQLKLGSAPAQDRHERIATGRLAYDLRCFFHGSYAHWSGKFSTACRTSMTYVVADEPSR